MANHLPTAADVKTQATEPVSAPVESVQVEFAPQADAPKKPDSKSPDSKSVDNAPKTRGEKFYDVFQFMLGKVFILAATAALAFAADQKYAPEKIAGVPNYLKKFQGWFHKQIFHNRVYPVAEKGDIAKLIGGGLVSTMVLSHGGNFFAPAIKWMENDREHIANAYNKKFGTPEEVDIVHERFKDNPQQDWGDIAKGRVMAWGTVFATMVGAYALVGKQKSSGRYYLDIYEDAFARKFTGLFKLGKEIAATPVARELTEIQKANSHYRLGKVLALDLYATTASIIIWNFFSRDSAKNRTLKDKIKEDEKKPVNFVVTALEQPSPEELAASNFAGKVEAAPKAVKVPKSSFAERVQLSENQQSRTVH